MSCFGTGAIRKMICATWPSRSRQIRIQFWPTQITTAYLTDMAEITREQKLQEWRAKKTAIPKKPGDKKPMPAPRLPLLEMRNMTKGQAPGKRPSLSVPSVAVSEAPHRPETESKDHCPSPMPFSLLRLNGEPQSLWAATTPSPSTQALLSAPHKNSYALPQPVKPRRSIQIDAKEKEESQDNVPSSSKRAVLDLPAKEFPVTKTPLQPETSEKPEPARTEAGEGSNPTPSSTVAAAVPAKSFDVAASALSQSSSLESDPKPLSLPTPDQQPLSTRAANLSTQPNQLPTPSTTANPSSPSSSAPLPKPVEAPVRINNGQPQSNRPAPTLRQAVAASLIAPSPRSSSLLPPKLGPHRRVSRAEMALEAALAGRRAGTEQQQRQSTTQAQAQAKQSLALLAADQSGLLVVAEEEEEAEGRLLEKKKRGRSAADLERESAVEEILLLGAVRDAEAVSHSSQTINANPLLHHSSHNLASPTQPRGSF